MECLYINWFTRNSFAGHRVPPCKVNKMDKKGFYQTLHCHTKRSDGSLNYKDIVDTCSRNNIGVVAFTDHDSLPDNKSYRKIHEIRDRKTDWIIGVEISASKPSDFLQDFSPHIVGLFVDPFNKDLIQHCAMAQEARKQRMSKMVKHLRDLGFSISEKDCLDASKGEAVGRPHIVQALKSKPINLEIIDMLRRKMEEESKKSVNIKEQYDEMVRRGEEQYPYVLFLSDNSFIKGVYEDYLYRLDLDRSVEIIRKSGGLAFFAHWFTEINKCGEKEIDKLLKGNRLDGVETVYGFYDDMKEDFVKQRQILKDLINKYQKLESGGVDAHTREHLEDFAKDKRYAEMTIGLTEKILLSKKVDVKQSSFNI